MCDNCKQQDTAYCQYFCPIREVSNVERRRAEKTLVTEG